MSSRTHSFSLAEVLIITGAMVLAAALVPRLLNSRLTSEATAVASVDIITSAQESYKTAYLAIISRLALICRQPRCSPPRNMPV